MTSRTSPTVRRRMLAAELKALRIAAKKTRDDAAQHISVAPSTVTKIENATAIAPVGNVDLLLDLYGVTNAADRAYLIGLARDARKRDWWQPYKKAIPPSLETYVGLEDEVIALRGYESEFIPGLLQVPEYHAAVLRTPPAAHSEDDIERLIEFRRARQERVMGVNGPSFWMILNEAVFRREVGGPEVMRKQLSSIRELIDQQRITLQILPFSSGAHPAMDGSFMILEFPERGHPDVVYLESLADSRYLETPDAVDRYNLVLNHLRAQALSSAQSLAVLARTESSFQ